MSEVEFLMLMILALNFFLTWKISEVVTRDLASLRDMIHFRLWEIERKLGVRD